MHKQTPIVFHEFAKNVYNVVATDSKGNPLTITRPNPYQWDVSGHDGTIQISYTLFANRGDGTYSQIDETHAHLNIPATFMFVPELSDRDITVDFKVREDLNWKVATQLPVVSDNTYSAPNLQYFMDSPTEISNFSVREFEVESNNKKQTVKFVLHHNGTEAELDTYWEKVKKIVLAEKNVFGELPKFDFGTYTFLACYVPNASGDGMEHRNSTILTDREGLAEGGMEGNIGTVSHEFFHAWNVERIRPKSLEPFDFTEANMSGELWFAEGFTSYYTNLLLCRAGIISPTAYVEGLTGTFNYVWNSPARNFFNPIEMSYQAPFVDAATSVDPVNRDNTFISYYSYGSVLGLALDLSLRQKNLNLDDYMKLVWKNYGQKESPFTIENLHKTLNAYAGADFGNQFFDNYIYQSAMPDYAPLFKSVGVLVKQEATNPFFGASVSTKDDGTAVIDRNVTLDGPAYMAGLSFKRFGKEKTTSLILRTNPSYSIHLIEKDGLKPSKVILENRKAWLKTE